MRDSRIAGFYRLSIPDRIARLEELGCLSAADAARLRDAAMYWRPLLPIA